MSPSATAAPVSTVDEAEQLRLTGFYANSARFTPDALVHAYMHASTLAMKLLACTPSPRDAGIRMNSWPPSTAGAVRAPESSGRTAGSLYSLNALAQRFQHFDRQTRECSLLGVRQMSLGVRVCHDAVSCTQVLGLMSRRV